MEQQSPLDYHNKKQTATDTSNTSTAPSSDHHRQPSRQVRTPTTDLDSEHSESSSSSAEPDSSEPSLLFPKPVGNTHLANWISTSDPDIMRITSESVSAEGGLADSTYELLTHADDTASENESQYENNDESFSESVSSLDRGRSDDVHSVSEDDEDDVPMLVKASLPVMELPERHMLPSERAMEEDCQSADESETNFCSPPPLPSRSAVTDHYDSEGESDSSSRSSLEYTHQQLGTPSIGAVDETPKASAVWKDKEHQKPRSEEEILALAAAHAWELIRDAFVNCFYHIAESTRNIMNACKMGPTERQRHFEATPARAGAFLLMQMLAALFMMALMQLTGFSGLCLDSLSRFLNTSHGKSDVGKYTVTGATQTISTITSTSSVPRALTTTSTDLNVHDDSNGLWIFTRDVGLSYSTVDKSFIVDIPDPLKKQWLSKDCVSVSATRGEQEIETKLEKVEEGVAARLRRRDTYGNVTFVVESTCRPTTKQTVTVNFGPYQDEVTALVRQTTDIVLRALGEDRSVSELLKQFNPIPRAHDILSVHSLEKAMQAVTDGLTTAQQAAKQSIGQALEISSTATSITLNTLSDKYDAFLKTNQGVKEAIKHRNEAMLRNAQTSLQLQLLNSQISAKLWWLKITGQEREFKNYRQKASEYMSAKEHAAHVRKGGCNSRYFAKGPQAH